MKLGVKLIGGFTIVALIVLVVGFFGLNGANRLGGNIKEIAANRLPSVLSLEIINEAQTAVDDAENALLATNLDAAMRKDALDRTDAAQKRAEDARKVYEPLPQSTEEAAVWAKFVPAWDEWWKSHLEFVRLEQEYQKAVAAAAEAAKVVPATAAAAKASAAKPAAPAAIPSAAVSSAAAVDKAYDAMSNQALVVEAVTFSAAESLLKQIIDINVKASDAAHSDAEASVKQVTTIALIGMAAGFAAALLLGIILSSGVLRQLGTERAMMMEIARRVSEGDLAIDLESKNGKNAVGAFASMKVMVVKLNEVLHGVQDAAAQVASSSEEISSSAQQLATGAQGQAATLEETSASIEELTASVEQVSEHAQNQAASVEQSSSSMTQMQGTVGQVSKTLGDVSTSSQESIQKAQAGAEAVVKAVGAIKAISVSSEKIAGIINVISDIADQTNLLALNASIEAARAGEHGRGFAVVADEVSKLADRSAVNTKEIEGLIKESGKSVTEGVQIAQGALEAMEAIIAGAKKTHEMVSALAGDVDQQINGIKEVAKATDSISEMSQSISAATEEQSTNAKQVSKAVENVNELTQQAASAAEEMSAATEELSSLAQRLLKQVEMFKLSEEGGAAGRQLAASAGQST